MALQMTRRRNTSSDEDIPMAPMIDCVFLLLIFFMVSAIMRIPRRLASRYLIPQQNTNFRGKNITCLSAVMVELLLMIKRCKLWKR